MIPTFFVKYNDEVEEYASILYDNLPIYPR